MTKHAVSNIGASKQPYGSRLMVSWAVAGCGVIVALDTASDIWSGSARFAGFGVALALSLALLFAALVRRYPPELFECLTFVAACAWIASGVITQGLDGIVWAYACIAALMLVSTTRNSEVFAACVVTCTGVVLWHTQSRETAVGAISLIVVFTALMKLYKIGMRVQRSAIDASRLQLELLLRCSDAGCIEWNGFDKTTRYSPRLCEMLGMSPDVDTLQIDFWSHLPLGFRNRVKTAFFSQVECVTAPYETVQLKPMEYPLIREDKSRIWVHARAIRISDGQGKLARYVCTFVDITARSEIERHLRAVNAGVEAQARDIMRQHMELEKTLLAREEVERISRHDLKTPLGQIASLTDSLRSVCHPTVEEDALLASLEATAQRAMRVLKLAIDFYPIEAGRFEFAPEPVDMVSVARRVCATFCAHAVSKRIKFVLHPEKDESWAQANVVLCETIIENLLKNAIEAAPDGSRITVRISEGSKVRVAIHNMGVVPLEVRGSFFQKYSTAGKPGGTGLGTYSAQLMAKAQSGDVRMSTCETEGTVLVLELMPVPDAQRSHASQPLRPVQAAQSFLIVDDDAYSASAVAGLVGKHGTAQTAVNGRAAINAVKTQRPDFIFIDLEMPVMGGMEAIGLIRKFQEAAGQQPSRIIAMSAHDDAQTRRKCKAAGFDRCLNKPVSRECVSALLDRVGICVNTSPRLSASSDFSTVSLQA